MATNLISLQGKIMLAKIVNGVVGASFAVGNAPDFKISTDADVIKHQESMSGHRTTDFTMTKTRSVMFEGELEEIDENTLPYIIDGKSTEIAAATVPDRNLGTVVAGQAVSLGGFNVTDVVITDSTALPVTVAASKYKLDAKFGTIVFNDIAGLEMPLKAAFKTGKANIVSINDSETAEYELTFQGINTVNNESVEVKLWRTKKDPKTEFPLIHEDFGSYKISGECLSKIENGTDPSLGLFGRMVTISDTE